MSGSARNPELGDLSADNAPFDVKDLRSISVQDSKCSMLADS